MSAPLRVCCASARSAAGRRLGRASCARGRPATGCSHRAERRGRLPALFARGRGPRAADARPARRRPRAARSRPRSCFGERRGRAGQRAGRRVGRVRRRARPSRARRAAPPGRDPALRVTHVALPVLARAAADAAYDRSAPPAATSPAASWRRGCSALGERWHEAPGPLALVGCGPQEPHTLGAIAFALALHARGWRITYLGADTPVASFLAAGEALRPRLVAVAFTLPWALAAAGGAGPARAHALALGPAVTEEAAPRGRARRRRATQRGVRRRRRRGCRVDLPCRQALAAVEALPCRRRGRRRPWLESDRAAAGAPRRAPGPCPGGGRAGRAGRPDRSPGRAAPSPRARPRPPGRVPRRDGRPPGHAPGSRSSAPSQDAVMFPAWWVRVRRSAG